MESMENSYIVELTRNLIQLAGFTKQYVEKCEIFRRIIETKTLKFYHRYSIDKELAEESLEYNKEIYNHLTNLRLQLYRDFVSLIHALNLEARADFNVKSIRDFHQALVKSYKLFVDDLIIFLKNLVNIDRRNELAQINHKFLSTQNKSIVNAISELSKNLTDFFNKLKKEYYYL